MYALAKPTDKSEPLDVFLDKLLGVSRAESIKSDTCVFCNKPATEFRDEVSRKEFTVSGICQKCQNFYFG